MYDAINKGVAFALKTFNSSKSSNGLNQRSVSTTPLTLTGDDGVIAWLNCDEQYLPGALKKVAHFFEAHPETDMLFGGMLMVDGEGELLACRKAMPMRRLFLEASYLYNYSCALFFRARIWKILGGFDTSFRNAGDEELIRRALKLGARCAVLNEYLATFTYAGDNLSSDPAAVEEHERLKKNGSCICRIFRVPLNILRLGEKFLRGGHVQRTPVEYEIYVANNDVRSKLRGEDPDCRWPDGRKPYLTSHRLK